MMRRLSIGIATIAIAFGFARAPEPARAAIPVVIKAHLVPTPSGNVASKYADGNDGTPATPLTWDNACLAAISFTAGTASSFDVRACLSYPVSGTTSIVVATDAGLPGVSFDATPSTARYLSCSVACTQGTGTYVFRATWSTTGVTAVNDGAVVVVNPAPSADTTPPTVPAALAGTSASSQVTLTWDPSADPFDGAHPGALDHYEILKDGVHMANLPVAAGLSAPFTQTILGSFSPTPTSSQISGSYSLTAAGTGIHNTTAEQALFRGQPVSGDWTLSTRIPGFVSAYQYSTGGIGFWSTLDQGAPFFACYDEPAAQHNGFQCKARYTLGGTSQNVIASVGNKDPPNCIKVTAIGDVYSGYYSSDANCSTWVLGASANVPAIGAAKSAAGFLSSQNAGVPETITLDQLALTPTSRVSYTFSDSGSHTYSVKAVDAAGNASAASSAVTLTVATSAGTGVRWHPGHYVLGVDVQFTGVKGYQDSYITGLGANTQGWEQLVSWSSLEPSQDHYDFSLVDAECTLADSVGKKLVIQVLDRNFSGTSGGGRLPAYLSSIGGIFVKPSGGVIAKIWLPAIAAREAALMSALGAHFDGRTCFEGVFTAEMDPGFAAKDAPADYTASAYSTGIATIGDAAVAAFPHANVWQSSNFNAEGQTRLEQIIAGYGARRIGFTTPDVVVQSNKVDSFDWGTWIVRGYHWNGSWTTTGGTSYLHQINLAHDAEDPEFGGKEGSHTALQIYNYSVGHGDSHLFWSRHQTIIATDTTAAALCYKNTGCAYSGGGTPTNGLLSPDIETFLAAGGHPMDTTCPASYLSRGGCDTTP